jgi:hypothetical protein
MNQLVQMKIIILGSKIKNHAENKEKKFRRWVIRGWGLAISH